MRNIAPRNHVGNEIILYEAWGGVCGELTKGSSLWLPFIVWFILPQKLFLNSFILLPNWIGNFWWGVPLSLHGSDILGYEESPGSKLNPQPSDSMYLWAKTGDIEQANQIPGNQKIFCCSWNNAIGSLTFIWITRTSKGLLWNKSFFFHTALPRYCLEFRYEPGIGF